LATLLLAGCLGFTTGATNIAEEPDGLFSVQLNFVVSCGAGEHCSWYVQYRQVLFSKTWKHIPASPRGPVTGPISKRSLSEKLTELEGGALYEYQVCGNAQPGRPFVCVGPDGTSNTSSRFIPATWHIDTTPTPSGATSSSLSRVSCAAIAPCVAVGSSNGSGTGLVELWDGGSWGIQTTPTPSDSLGGGLSGVSCLAGPTELCFDVGSYYDSAALSYVPLAEETWGYGWWILSTPDPATGALGGLGCASLGTCFATVIGSDTPKVDQWDGNNWVLSDLPLPPREDGGSVAEVTCTSDSACTAVGHDGSPGFEGTLAERWDGSTWKIQATPSQDPTPDVVASSLSGVSCTWLGTCMAVGSYRRINTSASVALAEQWDGSTWKTRNPPNPSGAKSVNLSGVSCTWLGPCMAVGSYVNSSGTTVALAEGYDGTTWSIQSIPIPNGAKKSSLTGVSCPALAGYCIAVGSYVNSAGTQLALAERYS
jgi:hypothetical protein